MRISTLATVVLALAVSPSLVAQTARQPSPDQQEQRREGARKLATQQVEFGIDLAQMSLWNDAALRFERAVQIDPSYAEAWNNLGIGYEQLGRLEDARDAYDQALLLAPGNQFMVNNYASFREIYDRQNVRGGGG